MQYRRLGQAGIKVSVLSFGSWVAFAKQLPLDNALACIQAAHDAELNFFDNARHTKKEVSDGTSSKELGWAVKLIWSLQVFRNRARGQQKHPESQVS